jgi:hypothetical protein
MTIETADALKHHGLTDLDVRVDFDQKMEMVGHQGIGKNPYATEGGDLVEKPHKALLFLLVICKAALNDAADYVVIAPSLSYQSGASHGCLRLLVTLDSGCLTL